MVPHVVTVDTLFFDGISSCQVTYKDGDKLPTLLFVVIQDEALVGLDIWFFSIFIEHNLFCYFSHMGNLFSHQNLWKLQMQEFYEFGFEM